MYTWMVSWKILIWIYIYSVSMIRINGCIMSLWMMMVYYLCIATIEIYMYKFHIAIEQFYIYCIHSKYIYIYHWLHQWQLPESNCQWHAVIYMYVYESICNIYVIHKASVNVYMYISIILYLFNVYQWSYWHMIDIAKNKMWYVHEHYCYCRICVIFYMIDCMHLIIGW